MTHLSSPLIPHKYTTTHPVRIKPVFLSTLLVFALTMSTTGCLDNYRQIPEDRFPWEVRLLGWWARTDSLPSIPCYLQWLSDTLIADPAQFAQAMEVLIFQPDRTQRPGRAHPLLIYIQCLSIDQGLPGRVRIDASWVWKDSLSEQPEIYIVPVPPDQFSEDLLKQTWINAFTWYRTGLTSYYTGFNTNRYLPVLTVRITQFTRDMVNDPYRGTLVLATQNQELRFALQAFTP